jgi:uncharacterized protein YutE (UPF0331/DUF86 family)
MYFVDREKMEERLSFIEKQILLFEGQSSWEQTLEKTALERIVHMTIEGMLDIGNSMIDGFIMRDPGSYEDIIDILEDEKVITAEMSKGLKEIISLRKSLIQDYTKTDHETILSVMGNELQTVKQFVVRVREYIETELGAVVTAFKPLSN